VGAGLRLTDGQNGSARDSQNSDFAVLGWKVGGVGKKLIDPEF
jgi:hypothetical protein